MPRILIPLEPDPNAPLPACCVVTGARDGVEDRRVELTQTSLPWWNLVLAPLFGVVAEQVTVQIALPLTRAGLSAWERFERARSVSRLVLGAAMVGLFISGVVLVDSQAPGKQLLLWGAGLATALLAGWAFERSLPRRYGISLLGVEAGWASVRIPSMGATKEIASLGWPQTLAEVADLAEEEEAAQAPAAAPIFGAVRIVPTSAAPVEQPPDRPDAKPLEAGQHTCPACKVPLEVEEGETLEFCYHCGESVSG